MNKIPFGKPILGKKEKEIVRKVLESGTLVHGPISLEFEKLFKNYTGAKDAITVSSCTAGMHLFYFTLGIGKGDEVIIPAQTHVATAHAVELTGAKPIFVDSENLTGNINISEIEKKITKKTKAITVVHYLGNPVDMIKVKKLAKKFKLLLLEDCALAIGATINKKHVGLFGDAGFFSFYPVKHITTGEGGMIILNNKKYSKILRKKKAFGYDKSLDQRVYPGLYDVDNLGFNYRMSEIHASIGTIQIKKIKEFLKIRSFNFKFLESEILKIKNISIVPNLNTFLKGSFYCLSILLSKKISKKRFNIINELKKVGIGSSIYYPNPIPRLKYYKMKYKIKPTSYKIASKFSDQIICLPIGPHVSPKEIKFMSKSLLKIITKYD
jgi:perosamine synthetase